MSERFQDKLPAQVFDELRWVQALIKEHPERFDMETWIDSESSICNTVGCIAGHIACRRMPQEEVARAFKLTSEIDERRKASQDVPTAENRQRYYEAIDAFWLLICEWRERHIPHEFADSFYNLFVTEFWPDEFLSDESGTTTPELAIQRIDYFLEHGV